MVIRVSSRQKVGEEIHTEHGIIKKYLKAQEEVKKAGQDFIRGLLRQTKDEREKAEKGARELQQKFTNLKRILGDIKLQRGHSPSPKSASPFHRPETPRPHKSGHFPPLTHTPLGKGDEVTPTPQMATRQPLLGEQRVDELASKQLRRDVLLEQGQDKAPICLDTPSPPGYKKAMVEDEAESSNNILSPEDTTPVPVKSEQGDSPILGWACWTETPTPGKTRTADRP